MDLQIPGLGGEGVKDLYDSERAAITQIRDDMVKKHSFRGVTTVKEEDEVKRRFTNEVRDRCQDVGFIIEVEWNWESEEKDEDGIPLHYSPCASGVPEDMNLYWLPRVIFIGRTDKLGEFDHDRQKHEVRSGLLDGKVGVIDPNTGKLSEDPKKKNIY
jgi:hypothetical protein